MQSHTLTIEGPYASQMLHGSEAACWCRATWDWPPSLLPGILSPNSRGWPA